MHVGAFFCTLASVRVVSKMLEASAWQRFLCHGTAHSGLAKLARHGATSRSAIRFSSGTLGFIGLGKVMLSWLPTEIERRFSAWCCLSIFGRVEHFTSPVLSSPRLLPASSGAGPPLKLSPCQAMAHLCGTAPNAGHGSSACQASEW